MGWIWLLAAGISEIFFATFLKFSDNFTKPLYTILFFLAAGVSFYSLTKAMNSIPIGTAYAIWTGIGAAGTAIIGIAFFKESSDLYRLFFLTLLVISIVGLKFVSEN